MFTITEIIWVIAVIAAFATGYWIADRFFAWIDR